jgi:hypothetical protein
MFPFHFLDRLGKHDVTCTVSGGGRSAQAGAIRLAMAKALCSFITEDEVEWMRQGMRSRLKILVVPVLSASVSLVKEYLNMGHHSLLVAPFMLHSHRVFQV